VKEQRICVKLCFKVGKTAPETHNMVHEAYSDDASSQTTTYKWFKHFKNGTTSTDDGERSGQPSTSRSQPLIAQVKNIICENQLTLKSCRRGWNTHWFMPHNFNGRFRNASGLGNIWAKTLE
jgi:hypothetical protein